MDRATAADILHLEVGQPNFPTPEPVIKAACEAAMDKNGLYTGYTPNMGYISLRKALASKLMRENGIDVEPNQILITPGSNYGIMIALSVLLNEGDEVLVPDPGYVNYTSLPPVYRATVTSYPLRVSDDFAPQIDSIADRITPRTKVIVHNSPSNPTGAVCSDAFVRELHEIARVNNLYVVSDETYEHIIFEGSHSSPGKYDKDGRVISIFSFSKSYAMTGWRLGYVVANRLIAETLEKQQELCVSCAPSISQKAAEAALKYGFPYLELMLNQYRRRRDLALAILRKHDLFSYTPHGAFYILVDISNTSMDSLSFAESLLTECHVAVAPGATFGKTASRYIRVALASEESVVTEGLERICVFIREKSKKS